MSQVYEDRGREREGENEALLRYTFINSHIDTTVSTLVMC